MVSTESDGGLLLRSEPAAVVGRVDVVTEGAEKISSPPPLVEEAADDMDELDGVRETEAVSSSGGTGFCMDADLVS